MAALSLKRWYCALIKTDTYPNLQLIANYLLVALELNFLDRFDKSRCMAKVLGNERN